MVESLQSIRMTCIKDYRSLPMFFDTAKGNTLSIRMTCIKRLTQSSCVLSGRTAEKAHF